MPSRHAATIDRLSVAFNARDLDGWLADATADFEMESRFSSVAGTIFRGQDGVVAWWRDLAEAWDWMEIEVQDSADVLTERTVILLVLRGVGHGSGMRLDESIAQRWYWRGERLSKINYMDRREAEMIVSGLHPR
jgi:ketosteroid isomerase-like protein